MKIIEQARLFSALDMVANEYKKGIDFDIYWKIIYASFQEYFPFAKRCINNNLNIIPTYNQCKLILEEITSLFVEVRDSDKFNHQFIKLLYKKFINLSTALAQ